MLNKYRKELDAIDNKIVSLLAERFRVTENIGEYKSENRLPAKDVIRESEKIKKIEQLADEQGLDPKIAKNIYRLIMSLAVNNHLIIAKQNYAKRLKQ